MRTDQNGRVYGNYMIDDLEWVPTVGRNPIQETNGGTRIFDFQNRDLT